MNRKKRKRIKQKTINKFLNYQKIESNLGLMASGMTYVTDEQADHAFKNLPNQFQKQIAKGLGYWKKDIIKSNK